MSERDEPKKRQVVYLMVPKKLAITYTTTAIVLFLGILGSYQYANYVDRQSNHRLCGVIVSSLKNAAQTQNTTQAYKQGVAAMRLLAEEFHCDI